ncbi:MAG: hypothetical protein MR239_05960 [Clostridiales bacterium]|nr:hypothetical protein [Clostridiales bacterium]MDY4655229.1 hypothetical protein [Eubacteriales bacterium]
MRKKSALSLIILVAVIAVLCGTVSFNAAYAAADPVEIVVIYSIDGQIVAEIPSYEGFTIYEGYSDLDTDEYCYSWELNGSTVNFPYVLSLDDATLADGRYTITFIGVITSRPVCTITIRGDEETDLSFSAGDTLYASDLSEEEAEYYYDENLTEKVTFPVTVEENMVLYADYPSAYSDDGNKEPVDGEDANPESAIDSIECEHSQIAIEGEMTAGSLVEITLSNYEKGYALDYVLVSCDGEAVVTERRGNVISFIMPDGKISVKVVFKASSSQTTTATEKTALFGTKEIVAVSVAGAVLLIGAVIMIIKTKKKV